MKVRHLLVILSIVFPWLGSASAARAAPLVVEAGQAHTLQEDVVLSGNAVLEVRGTPDRPCVLVGNRHRIRSGDKWTGSLKITHCTLRDLGGLPRRAVETTRRGSVRAVRGGLAPPPHYTVAGPVCGRRAPPSGQARGSTC